MIYICFKNNPVFRYSEFCPREEVLKMGSSLSLYIALPQDIFTCNYLRTPEISTLNLFQEFCFTVLYLEQIPNFFRKAATIHTPLT
jgi:hypothetical protein